MINWISAWYNPRVDGDAEALAEQMGNIVLNGIVAAEAAQKMSKCHPDSDEVVARDLHLAGAVKRPATTKFQGAL